MLYVFREVSDGDGDSQDTSGRGHTVNCFAEKTFLRVNATAICVYSEKFTEMTVLVQLKSPRGMGTLGKYDVHSEAF